MDFFDKTKGIISVFLIIILLPTMLFSVLLVDAARMVSARAMVQEASDLAAMSVLTSYDPDLKEAYGLFALKDSGSVTLVTFSISSMGREAAGSFKSGREIPLLVNIDILFSPLAKGWSGLYYENKGM